MQKRRAAHWSNDDKPGYERSPHAPASNISTAFQLPWSADIVNSSQNVDARAHEVTSTLEEILHHLPPPTHYGLNE